MTNFLTDVTPLSAEVAPAAHRLSRGRLAPACGPLKHLGRALTLVLLCVTLAFAQSDSDARFSDIGNKMMCQCGCGQVLLQCNHVGCSVSTQMSSELREALAQGKTDDQVFAAFTEKYGPVVLAAPTKTGFNRVAWIVPYAALAFGLALVGGIVHLWRKRQQPQIAAAGDSGDDNDSLHKRVRQETEL